MITGYNNKIATRPFPKESNQIEIKSGFAEAVSRISLTPLQVVFGQGTISPKDTVFVTKECGAQAWAKNVIELEGEMVIVVPIASIEFVKRGSGWNDAVGTTAI